MPRCIAHLFFSSRRRHTSWPRDWSSDVCSSDLRDTSAPKLARCRSIGVSRKRCTMLSGCFWGPAWLEESGGLESGASARSEERRVGNGGRARRATKDHSKQTVEVGGSAAPEHSP